MVQTQVSRRATKTLQSTHDVHGAGDTGRNLYQGEKGRKGQPGRRSNMSEGGNRSAVSGTPRGDRCQGLRQEKEATDYE